jgi:hypothetical protein
LRLFYSTLDSDLRKAPGLALRDRWAEIQGPVLAGG